MAKTKNTKAFYNTEIPSDWKICKLGDCCLAKGEYGINAPAVEFSDDLPTYLRITDIDDNGNYSTDKKVSVDDLNYKQFVLKDGDIVFARTGATVGKTYLYKPTDGMLVFAGFLIRFRTEEKLLIPQHLKYFTEVKFYWDWVKTVSMRSGQPGINAEEYASLKIPLPPLPEQKAIVRVLSTWDTAIHKTQQLISQKELRKKWLMQNLLTGKMKLKGFGGEWKETYLGEMFTERNETKCVDLPLLSIGQNGVYPQDESDKKDTSNKDKSKYKRICPGDIGYNTMRMWQGRSALSQLEGIVSPAYTVVIPKKNADSVFFSYLFKTSKMTNLFWRNSQGLVDDTLNCKFKDFCIVKTILPQTKQEQTVIAQVLQSADNEVNLLKAKAEKLRKQKKGLMQQLLTGKKRLKVEL